MLRLSGVLFAALAAGLANAAPIDVTRPIVSAVSPANAATGVAVNRVVSATFSEQMKCTTVTTGTFKLKTATGTAVSGTVKCNGAYATFTPAVNLAAGKRYTATLSTGVRDNAGNALAVARSWSFTTSASAVSDKTRPTVAVVRPANGQSGVALGTKVSATFSEYLDCATVTSTTFAVKKSGGANFPGAVTCSGKTATFTPAAPLPAGTLCVATLTTGIRDQARNSLATGKSWTFATVAPQITIADATVAEEDADGHSLEFTLSLNAPASRTVTVDYETSDGAESGATGGNDYTVASGQVSIPAGATSATIAVEVLGDLEKESDEQFQVTLSSPVGATLGDAVAIGTILDDDPLSLAIQDGSATELDDGEETVIEFLVELNGAAAEPVSANYASVGGRALGGESCGTGVDFIHTSGSLEIAAGERAATVQVTVCGDQLFESGDETFTLALSDVAGAGEGDSSANGTIVNDDATLMNDTGVTACATESARGLSCPQAGYSDQDADLGRDVTDNSADDGRNGFSFTKLDASGNALAADAVTWACTLDNVTGRVWEHKVSGNTLHGTDETYSWYQNGNGSQVAYGCFAEEMGSQCNTARFVEAVNAEALCGFTDWRLPTMSELVSLVDYSIPLFGPMLDAAYVTVGTNYLWSSDRSLDSAKAWSILFDNGAEEARSTGESFGAILVRGGD